MQSKKGVMAAAGSYAIWGMLPLYWQLLDKLNAIYILTARVCYSFALCLILATAFQKWPEIKRIVLDKKALLKVIAAGYLISFNWFIYIWAVNNGHILDSSMGYYMNPLVVVLFGAVIFHERLDKWEITAVILAVTGVALMLWQYGKFPWIAVSLALSFAAYGAVKKSLQTSAIVSLCLETAAVTPLALGVMLYYEASGCGIIALHDAKTAIALVFVGAVSAAPLLLYAYGVQHLPFAMVGFFQYISPTLSLILGITVLHESFAEGQLLTLSFIWAALAVYILSRLKNLFSFDFSAVRQRIKKV